MKKMLRESLEDGIRIYEKYMDPDEMAKREPKVGTKEYDQWLKISFYGAWITSRELLENFCNDDDDKRSPRRRNRRK